MISTIEPSVLILILSLVTMIMVGIVAYNPVIGLVFLCFLLPLESFVAEMPIPLYPILGALIVSGYILNTVLKGIPNQSFGRQFHFDILLMLLLVLCIILRNPEETWYSVDSGKSVMLTYIQLAVIYYLSSRLLHGKNLSWLALGLMFGTTLSAIYGIITVGTEGLLISHRLAGAHGNPNSLAYYSLCSLALLPAIQRLCQSNWQGLIVDLLGTFQLIIVFLTMSKTGFLAVGFLVMIWLSFYKSTSVLKRNILVGSAVLLILIFIIPTHYWKYMYDKIVAGILQTDVRMGSSMGARYDLWHGAYLAFKSSPIWGIGVGQFIEFSAKYSFLKGTHVVHNSYLTILAENGIVGLCLFLGWLGLAIYRFGIVLRKGKTDGLRTLAFSGLCAFAMLQFFLLAGNAHYSKLLWLVAGSSIALTMDNKVLENNLNNK
jgi:O-antigen ligase